jgi:hypothetical protein
MNRLGAGVPQKRRDRVYNLLPGIGDFPFVLSASAMVDAGRSGEGMPQDRIAGRKIDGRVVCRTKILKIALGGVLAAFAMCANYSAARAGDDDVKDESLTDKIMHSFGLKAPDDTEYEINYSERSPLVVPPNRNLPPPVLTNAPPAPNWPVDPEVKKRAASKGDDKPTPRPYDSVMNSSRPLTPAELGVGRSTAVPAPGEPEQSSPSQLGEKKGSVFSFDWLKKEQYGTFTGEPPRVSLTDPPAGYQTPSPDQPYGITPEQKTYKPPSLGERMEPVSGAAGSPGH